jgi:high affinity sulfate transporter 1
MSGVETGAEDRDPRARHGSRGMRLSRLPILEGILPNDRARIAPDLIAGATLAALAIPEVMGYTKIAGTPVITGLYTILLPVLLFAVLGSSRHLVVGADSATAAILATGLLAMGATTGSPQYVELASLAALLCAALLVLARLLRLGFIANFLSRSVLIGFLTGVGIQVAMGQVGGMFGIGGESGRTVQKFVETLGAIPASTSVPTMLVSLFVLVTIVGLERINKKVPGALLAVVAAILASYALDFSSRGISVLGTVPGGLPALSLPTSVMTVDNLAKLLPTAISLVVVILAQSAATSRAYAMKYADSFNENVDLIGLGAANLGAAITGTFVVNGSPTKTEMVDSAGGRSQTAQLGAAAIVVAVLLFLTGPLAYMPNAVLASVVFIIGLRLVDIAGMRDIYRLRKGEFAVAAITALTVVVLGVEQGIILAMGLSIVEHVYHSYRPYDTLLVETPERELRTAALEGGGQLTPGVAAYRFGSGLYYANAARFTEEVMGIVERAEPPLRALVLVGSAIADVDYSGADSLRQVRDELARQHVALALADISPAVRHQLDAYGLTEQIGAANIFESVREAATALREAPAPGQPLRTDP